MSENSRAAFEQIKSYKPYVDDKLNALVDLCELLNSGLIDVSEYKIQREVILKGRSERDK